RRLTILSTVILAAMLGMVGLGYHSIRMWEKGLHGARLGEFTQAGEQIRRDVTRKLSEFIAREQSRPHTDYQYYHVPENIAPNQQMTVLTSPLRFNMSNGLAYGYFQIDSSGNITTPYLNPAREHPAGDEATALAQEAAEYTMQLRKQLLPLVKISSRQIAVPAPAQAQQAETGRPAAAPPAVISYDKATNVTTSRVSRAHELKIENLLAEEDRQAQTFQQQKARVSINIASNKPYQPADETQQQASPASIQAEMAPAAPAPADTSHMNEDMADSATLTQSGDDMVDITIESFVPVIVEDESAGPIFRGQVYLVRHVRIGDRSILQGFRFDEQKLLEEIQDSARIIPDDMVFEMQPWSESGVQYTTSLSFGSSGELLFGLRDRDAGRLSGQIASLRHWYFGTVAIVFAATGLGLASVWRNVRAQAVLAAKKDDFISAVSHELRTPLTSIRMQSEMLERNWIKSQEKTGEYYRSMRQESERLSRLIENVLDFARIQRGRKKYNFMAGDLNKCIGDVIEMMRPYAAQKGFTIHADLGGTEPVTFDRDSVIQIVVNLLDNAIKYSRESSEKTIYVRTRPERRYTVIEVEDRGPGVPYSERKKIFEQFYRVAAESTREVPGTGLGLALVKKFVEAHHGFIEVVPAQPAGALFRVGLPASS
ncbi:MAG TPA: HAMP domain-containing sensor histidine kinase, partial [Sedimentisphaerales bacterium]|nr:HAMP domain-containing sensor histidine kinase [Sedimentisphaerales bacterium]